MTAFVILHYRAIDMTRICVERIRDLDGCNHIVIVDNASPNGTGAVLAKEYAGKGQITVLLNKENAGFARGNNLGIAWAKENLAAEFVVVLNNDVEILQKDFAVRIGEIYREHPFDVLGTDVLSVFSGIHQNPKSLKGCTLESVRSKQAKVKRSSNPVLLLLSSGEKNSPVIWKRVLRRQRAKQQIDSSAPAKRYLEGHPQPFYPRTYMYYEMEILEWRCRREGNVIRYDPSVSVRHYQYVASKQEYRSIVRQSKFVMDCLMDSLAAAEELILSADGEESR